MIGRYEGYLLVGDIVFLTDNPAAIHMANWLKDKRLEGVYLTDGTEIGELARFCEWLLSNREEVWSGEHISIVRIKMKSPLESAVETHSKTVGVLAGVYDEVSAGAIPDLEKIRDCAKGITQLLAEKPATLQALLLIKNYDDYTYHHSVNVCSLALALGKELNLGSRELDWLGEGGLLHDIGKTRTPEAIVRKPGPLSKKEWSIMTLHPKLGGDIVRMMEGLDSAPRRMVFEHHMRENGGGYPERPPGYKIAPLSSIVMAADIYDAITSHRSYSIPHPLPEAVRIIKKLGREHLNPEVVNAFGKVLGEVPEGSIARLASGEVVVICDGGNDSVYSSRVVIESNGKRREKGDFPIRGIGLEEVVRWGTPLMYGIDVLEVLKP